MWVQPCSRYRKDREYRLEPIYVGSTLLQVWKRQRVQTRTYICVFNQALGTEKTENRIEHIYVGSTLLQVQKRQRVEVKYVGSTKLQVQKRQRIEQNLYIWVQPCSRYRKVREQNITYICGFNPALGTERTQNRMEPIYVGSTLVQVQKRQIVKTRTYIQPCSRYRKDREQKLNMWVQPCSRYRKDKE